MSALGISRHELAIFRARALVLSPALLLSLCPASEPYVVAFALSPPHRLGSSCHRIEPTPLPRAYATVAASTRSACDQSTVDRAISERHVAQPTVSRRHRTIRCAIGLSGVPRGQWLAAVGFAKERSKSGTIHCPVVHQTVRCVHGHKTTKAYQMELQRLLGSLGAIKGTLGAWSRIPSSH